MHIAWPRQTLLPVTLAFFPTRSAPRADLLEICTPRTMMLKRHPPWEMRIAWSRQRLLPVTLAFFRTRSAPPKQFVPCRGCIYWTSLRRRQRGGTTAGDEAARSLAGGLSPAGSSLERIGWESNRNRSMRAWDACDWAVRTWLK